MCAKKTGSLEDLAVVGVDIGKDTFHLVGFDRAGQLVMRKQIKRLALNATFEQLPRCIVGMEACLSAHFVSRTLRGMGFEPRIIPAIYVKPFNKGQKNDYNDAEAIAEAALRPNLRTVSEKDQDQLDLQALHRVRARLVSRRTATINQIRAFLIEQGITVRSGLRALEELVRGDPRTAAGRDLAPDARHSDRALRRLALAGQTDRGRLGRDRGDQPHGRELRQRHDHPRRSAR